MSGMKQNKALWLTATAAIAASAVPTPAEVYLTESQALGVVLGEKAIVRREQKSLDPALRKRLEAESGLRFPETSVTFFIAAQNGIPGKYALAMNEIGKSEPITFMVGMSPEGKVAEVVIMEFRENRGWEVREKRFLNQFRGKTAKNLIRVDEDIINYTGATLSSKAVARGVKRALLLLDAFYPGESRYKLNAKRDFAMPSELRAAATISARVGSLGLYQQTRYAMGTHCEIRAWCFAPGEAHAAFEKGFGELERIEQIFSAYREDSELSHVNRNAGDRKVLVSPEFFEAAQFAVNAAEQSEGAVNFAVGPVLDLWKRCEMEQRWPMPQEIANARMLTDARNVQLCDPDRSLWFNVPGMKLDFGGVAKGYAAEKVGRLLEKWGVVSALVNLGRSSIYVTKVHVNFPRDDQGSGSDRVDAWPLAILKPGESREITETLLLGPEDAVSTSGTTERGLVIRGQQLSHVLNAGTGIPIRSIASATVVGRGGMRTEIASKALLFAGCEDQFKPNPADEVSYWTRISPNTGVDSV